MKNHVATLEQSRKLLELGVSGDTILARVKDPKAETLSIVLARDAASPNAIPTFTAGEICEIIAKKVPLFEPPTFDTIGGWFVRQTDTGFANFAPACADLLIHLIEKGKIKF